MHDTAPIPMMDPSLTCGSPLPRDVDVPSDGYDASTERIEAVFF